MSIDENSTRVTIGAKLAAYTREQRFVMHRTLQEDKR